MNPNINDPQAMIQYFRDTCNEVIADGSLAQAWAPYHQRLRERNPPVFSGASISMVERSIGYSEEISGAILWRAPASQDIPIYFFDNPWSEEANHAEFKKRLATTLAEAESMMSLWDAHDDEAMAYEAAVRRR